MNSNITLCLLLSASDQPLWPSWINNHDGIFTNIIVGKDGEFDIPINPDWKSHVKVVENPLNNDFAAARNRLLDLVQSSYVCMLDADELIFPDTKSIIDNEILYLHKYDFLYAHRYNVFQRSFQDFPNYHAFLMRSTCRYSNNQLGCHETIVGRGIISNCKVLHLKEQWVNFRSKGFVNHNQQAALDDLNHKIDNLNQKLNG